MKRLFKFIFIFSFCLISIHAAHADSSDGADSISCSISIEAPNLSRSQLEALSITLKKKGFSIFVETLTHPDSQADFSLIIEYPVRAAAFDDSVRNQMVFTDVAAHVILDYQKTHHQWYGDDEEKAPNGATVLLYRATLEAVKQLPDCLDVSKTLLLK